MKNLPHQLTQAPLKVDIPTRGTGTNQAGQDLYPIIRLLHMVNVIKAPSIDYLLELLLVCLPFNQGLLCLNCIKW